MKLEPLFLLAPRINCNTLSQNRKEMGTEVTTAIFLLKPIQFQYMVVPLRNLQRVNGT